MNSTLKNASPAFVATFLLAATLFSCRTEQSVSCMPIEKPLSLHFPNDTLIDIKVLPFEPSRIWVDSRRGMFSLDLYTGQETPLSSLYRNFFNVEDEYFEADPYDSLMWIGGSNRHVAYYDSKTRELKELPVNYVHRVIVRPDKVYFITLHQVCYWDRKTKIIHQVAKMPLEFIQSCETVDDTTFILERQYTYYLHSNRFVRGVFAGDHKFRSYFRTKDDNALLYGDTSYCYVWKGKVMPLPLPVRQNPYNTNTVGGKYWQWDDKFCYVYDPRARTSEKFPYRLPPVNNYVTDVLFDVEYIWIQRPAQLILIDISNHQQLESPVQPEGKFIKVVPSDCNVYIVFENKIVISSKEDFIETCKPFDVALYEAQIVQLNKSIDSLGLTKDTIAAVALKKLNFIKEKYGAINNVEVKQKLSALNYMVFYNVPLHSPKEYEDCYRDGALPIVYRKSCLNSLIDQYGRNSDFKKVLSLEKEFYKYFGRPDQEMDYRFIQHVNSVRKYVSRIDSLEKSGLTADSLYYFEAQTLGIICSTNWYCHQGCGGCDFSSVTNLLKPFAQKFPESKLVDNVELHLLQFSFMYDEDESFKQMNKQYQAFALAHPDSDMLADVWYNIFQNNRSMSTPDKKGMKEAGKKFLQDFGSDKRATEIREELKALGME